MGAIGCAMALGLAAARPACAQPAFTNADLETAGPLTGWTNFLGHPLEADARVCRRRLVRTSELRVAGRRVFDAPLGGSYWNVPFPALVDVGQEAQCYLSVPSVLAVSSPPVDASGAGFLSWLMRVTPLHARLRVDLLDAAGTVLQTIPAPSTGTMVRVSFDLAKVPAASRRTLRLRFFPVRGARQVEVDSFRLHTLRPAPPSPSTRETAPAPEGVWGFADLHTHPFANLAYGGPDANGAGLIFGAPDADLATRFGRCEHGRGDVQTSLLTQGLESVGHAGEGGHPDYKYWPRFNSVMHQQLHVQWLRRAWQGGLRLVVAHAVNNMLLARYWAVSRPSANDLVAARAQLDAITAMVGASDFMEIARSPADARSIIGRGHLAVVLGVEIDAPGDCHVRCGILDEQTVSPCPRTCTTADVDATLDELERRGVRHVFPVHLADNQFGGSAVYSNLFFYFDHWARDGGQMDLGLARPDQHVSYDLDIATLTGYLAAGLLVNTTRFPDSVHSLRGGTINRRPLQPLGELFVQGAWDRGMLVDVDHMSDATMDGAVALARRRGVPVIAGHTSFRELQLRPGQTDVGGKLAAENAKSVSGLRAIQITGGVVGVGTGSSDTQQQPALEDRPFQSHVPDRCGGSSQSFLQLYDHAVRRTQGVGIALGTDMHLQEQLFPRFGVWACLGRNDDAKVAAHPDARRGASPTEDADFQRFAVAYDQPPRTFWSTRFMRPTDDPKTEAYDVAERAFWQALVITAAAADPLAIEYGTRWDWPHDTGMAQHFAIGLQQLPQHTAPDCTDRNPRTNQLVGGAFNYGCGERRAAFLVKTGATVVPATDAPAVRARVAQLLPRLRRVWLKFEEMTRMGGNVYAPLKRCQGPDCAGNREFDYNLDGLAHYGLLPDLLQDVSNQLEGYPGGEVRDLRALFHSAEDYIRAWERIWQTRRE